MYDLLLQTMLLVLPTFGSATPAQPPSSINLVAPGPGASNALLPAEPIDRRFSMRPLYRAEPALDVDQSLVVAVQFLGYWGQISPFTAQVPNGRYWDDHLPLVEIRHHGPGTYGTTEARHLIWGLYLGVKGMIESDTFRNVRFVLRWDGHHVGSIYAEKRAVRLSLPGDNSTAAVRQGSSHEHWAPSASESLNSSTSADLSIPDTASLSNPEVKVEITSLGQPLPKYDVIMAVLEGILAAASRPVHRRISGPVTVVPPLPYQARLELRPEQTTPGQPVLDYGLVAWAIREIPADLLLKKRQWAEVNFDIVLRGVVVAKCSILKGRE